MVLCNTKFVLALKFRSFTLSINGCLFKIKMLEDFEKKTCKAAEQVLKSKLFKAIETKYPSSKFNELGEAVLTSLLVCSYMKTFDNQDTVRFLASVKKYSENWNFQLTVPKSQRNSGQNYTIINMIMSSEWMTPCNKPLIELLYGQPIKKLNEVLLFVGSSNLLLA